MSANPGFAGRPEKHSLGLITPHIPIKWDASPSKHTGVTSIDQAASRQGKIVSRWTQSKWKRAFDIACVLGSLPLTVPMFLSVGLVVRVTSRGPVLFRQQRMGRNGQPFTIFKFRTMPVRRIPGANRPTVTTSINQRFTPVGPFLRRWKLDEIPQLLNVLRGEMSVVGPRPKLAHHQTSRMNCRPGITGRATFVFAREEMVLSSLPSCQLDGVYHSVILPLKQRLDEEYMATATLQSDVELIFNSVLRKWEDLELRHLIQMHPEFATQLRKPMEKPVSIPIVGAHHQSTMHRELRAD